MIDAVIKALEYALPARVPGGHRHSTAARFYGLLRARSCCSSTDAPHRRRRLAWRDRRRAVRFNHGDGDLHRSAGELEEKLLLLLYEDSLREYLLVLQIVVVGFGNVTHRAGACSAQTSTARLRLGVQGGKEAKPGALVDDWSDCGGERREDADRLEPGDCASVETGGGGGYGLPRHSSLDAIEHYDAGDDQPRNPPLSATMARAHADGKARAEAHRPRQYRGCERRRNMQSRGNGNVPLRAVRAFRAA